MLIDTHCHINMMIKKEFDVPLHESSLPLADTIIKEAQAQGISTIINVGTRYEENKNCITLAKRSESVFATVGIHPNDSDDWESDIVAIEQWVSNKEENKIVGIGECGMDRHYPNHNLKKQHDAFKAQIETALKNDLALVIHSRDAYDETLTILDEYKKEINRAVMHCYSYDSTFAKTVLEWNFFLGIGGTITYPKNNELRDIIKNCPISSFVLETDAPFLPIQTIRGKQNHPKYIKAIAEYIAQLRNQTFEFIQQETTKNACLLFKLKQF